MAAVDLAQLVTAVRDAIAGAPALAGVYVTFELDPVTDMQRPAIIVRLQGFDRTVERIAAFTVGAPFADRIMLTLDCCGFSAESAADAALQTYRLVGDTLNALGTALAADCTLGVPGVLVVIPLRGDLLGGQEAGLYQTVRVTLQVDAMT